VGITMLIEVVAYSSATRFSLHSQLLVGSLPKGKGSRFPYGNRLPDKHAFLRGASMGQTHFSARLPSGPGHALWYYSWQTLWLQAKHPKRRNKEVHGAFRHKHFKHYRPPIGLSVPR